MEGFWNSLSEGSEVFEPRIEQRTR